MPLYDLGDIDRMDQLESMEQDEEENGFEAGNPKEFPTEPAIGAEPAIGDAMVEEEDG